MFLFLGKKRGDGVTISIAPLDQPAVPVRDALHHAAAGLDVEAARGSHGHTSEMDAGLLAGGHGRHHHVAGTEAPDRLLARQITADAAASVQARALIAATARALDRERRPAPAGDRINSPDAGGIQRMGLRNTKNVPVPFRAPARSGFNRQSGGLQRTEQRPAGRIDGSGILERALELGLNLCQPRRPHFSSRYSRAS